MNLLKWFNFNNKKEMEKIVAPVASYHWNKPQWSEDSLAQYYKQGYSNPYVFRSINLITDAFNSINIYIQDADGQDIDNPEILALLTFPNPQQSLQEFVQLCLLNYFLGGAAYVLSVSDNEPIKPPKELYCISPMHMSAKATERLGDKIDFVYKPQNKEYIIDGARVYWFKNVNPSNLFSAFSNASVASKSIDSNNYYLEYIKNLFANDGIPPSYITTETGFLTDTQRKEVKDSFYDRYGRRLLATDGNIKFAPLGWSPRELSILTINQMTVKDIGVAFGISPILLGDSGQSTYSNYASARAQLYLETVIPLALKFYGGLSRWLSQRYQQPINIKIDLDSVDALNVVRESKWASVINAYNSQVIKLNEAREALGYGVLEDGDVFKIPSDVEIVATYEKQFKFNDTKASKKKRIKIMPPNKHRKLMRQLTAEMTKTVATFFKNKSEEMIKPLLQYYLATSNAKKTAEDDYAQHIAEALSRLDLTSFKELPAEISEYIEKIIQDSALITAKITSALEYEQILELMNVEARRYAQERAAELVGMRYVNGELIPNPNAKWRIDETTREALKDTVTSAYQESWSYSELAKNIQDGFAFSKSRAEMIARTELAKADTHGTLMTMQEAGVPYKEWVMGSYPCPACEANADVGIIPIDEPFPSGDVPVHPNCECVIVGVLEKE